MAKDRLSATTSDVGGTDVRTARVPADESRAGELCVASHEVLFAAADEPRCDACGTALPQADEDGYSVAGQGLYVWVRGDEIRREDAPLCASCASAIGMTALARWEIEEEEG